MGRNVVERQVLGSLWKDKESGDVVLVEYVGFEEFDKVHATTIRYKTGEWRGALMNIHPSQFLEEFEPADAGKEKP